MSPFAGKMRIDGQDVHAAIREICEAALRDDFPAVERWIREGSDDIAVTVIACLTARDLHRIYTSSGAAPAKAYAKHRLGILPDAVR